MLSLLCQNQFGKHLAALCTVHFPGLCQVTVSTEFTTAFSLSNQRLLSHPGQADYHGARHLGNPKTNGLSYSGFQSILFGNQEDRLKMELWGSSPWDWSSHTHLWSSDEKPQWGWRERRRRRHMVYPCCLGQYLTQKAQKCASPSVCPWIWLFWAWICCRACRLPAWKQA